MVRDLSKQSIIKAHKDSIDSGMKNQDLNYERGSRPQSGKFFNSRKQSAKGPRPPLKDKKPDTNFRNLISNRQMNRNLQQIASKSASGRRSISQQKIKAVAPQSVKNIIDSATTLPRLA